MDTDIRYPSVIPGELNPPLNPHLVVDAEGLQMVTAFFQRATEFGFDVETNVVDFFLDRRARTIQVGNREEQYVIDLLALCGWDKEALHTVQGEFGTKLPQSGLMRQLIDTLRPALESNTWLKLGHNLEFDYTTAKWCLGLRPWNLYDTLLAERIIHLGAVPYYAKDFWGLDDLVRRYLQRCVDKSEQTGFGFDGPLTQAQVEYAALDVRLPFAIRSLQRKVLRADGLERVLKIENDAIPAFCDMHINGLLIDQEKWMSLVNATKAEHAENVRALDKHFLPVVGAKVEPKHDLAQLEAEWRNTKDRAARAAARVAFYAARKEVKTWQELSETFEGEAALNYGSNPQLLAALRKAGFGEKKLRDTNDRSLKKLAGNPIIDALRDYRETSKVLSTYGEKFLAKYVNPITGRVHSRFKQLGADTGRTSSEDPNVQNILRGADWRGCFVAPPGYKIITLDFNGCELRILAELSQEPVWIEAFKNDWDVHSVGAEILFRDEWKNAAEAGCAYYEKHAKCSCKGHKKLRDRIKAINFGLAYGMEYKKLAEELGISKDEAKHLMETYKGQFVVVTLYLENSGRSAMAMLEARTMSGRRRKFQKPSWEQAKVRAIERLKKQGRRPEDLTTDHINSALAMMWGGIQREGKNTPIQGTNADIAKLAMGCGFDPDGKPYAWHLIEPVYDAKMVNFVHDEFVVESKDEVVEECFAAVADCMERAGAEFVKSIRMTTEGHIADCWTK